MHSRSRRRKHVDCLRALRLITPAKRYYNSPLMLEQIFVKEIGENDRKLQCANNGCWRPSSDLVVPAQHAGLEWLWQPDHLDAPVFKTAPQMRALLNQTGNVLFIGDWLMRTTFQAFVDVALDYQFPYHGIREKWCGRNGTQHFGGLGSLTIDGNGCHSGHASFLLSLGQIM